MDYMEIKLRVKNPQAFWELIKHMPPKGIDILDMGAGKYKELDLTHAGQALEKANDGHGRRVDNEGRQRIIELLNATPGMTPRQMAAETGLNIKTMYNRLHSMKKAGLLRQQTNGAWINKQQ